MHPKCIDRTGQRYGKLTVIRRVPSPFPNRRGSFWECRCDCENTTIVSGGNLGVSTKSCGCIPNFHPLIDMTGQTFGRLTVIGKAEPFQRGKKHYWVAKCICGNIIAVEGKSLRTGNGKSCGCLRKESSKKLGLLNRGRTRVYRSDIPIRVRKYLSNRKTVFGLTPQEWTKLVLDSNGHCGCCRRQFRNSNDAHTDHDHITGKVRELICNPCNTKLSVRENINWLLKADAYLRKHGSAM